jgi:TPR repeat protein
MLIGVGLAILPAAALHAAPALSAGVQAELDRAVLDYESGRLKAARTEFESLARRHVPAAEYNLAVMHLRKELPDADPGKARRLLTRSAQGGFVTGQYMLGQALETGQFGAADLVEAHRWYGMAAAAGSVPAQVAMGTAHYLGRGLAKDARRAAEWFREAAKGGDVGAMYLLASMYEQGDGVAQDLRLARYWYALAALQGDEAAPGKVRELDERLAARPG